MAAPLACASAARRSGVGAVVALTIVLAGCVTPTTAVRPLAWHETKLGLCEDYPEETRSIDAARDDLRLARESGATVLI